MVDQVLQSNHGLDRSGGFAAVALLASGLVGSLAFAPAAIAGVGLTSQMGQATLIAQEIVDGLPPPPNVGQNTLPVLPQSQQAQAQQVQPQQMQPQEMTAPDQASSDQVSLEQASRDRRYLVMINGDSPRLLRQVQRVASSASVQDYQGQRMIVAAFDDSNHAQRQVQLLASRGIGARIVQPSEIASAANRGDSNSGGTPSSAPNSATVSVQRSAVPMAVSPDLPPADLMPNPSVPTVQVPSQIPQVPQAPNPALRETPSGAPREVTFGGQPPSADQFPSPPALPAPPASAAFINAPTNLQPSDLPSGHSYYVIVPGKQGELDAISNQIIRLSDGFGIAQLVQQSTTKGTHVQVGPFSDRQAASRWNRYFRDFGMDARVTRDR
jgi:hypothetical protein